MTEWCRVVNVIKTPPPKYSSVICSSEHKYFLIIDNALIRLLCPEDLAKHSTSDLGSELTHGA